MSKNKRRSSLKKILTRDNDLCGIHAGGCGEKIEPLDPRVDRDHIYPKSFFKDRPNAKRFNDLWNLQPMHRDCHELRGRGQLISGVIFQCTCHYNYVDEKGNRFAYYKQPGEAWHNRRDSKWEFIQYHEGRPFKVPEPIRRHNPADPTFAYSFKAGSTAGGKQIGFIRGQIGHTMVPLAPFHRLLSNSTELFRCMRWAEVLQETTKFAELRESVGEQCLIKEAGPAYWKALIKHHTQAYVAGMFTTDGFMDGSLRLSDNAVNVPGQLLEEFHSLASFHDETSERTVSLGVLHEILTYVEYLLEIGAVQFSEIEGESSTQELLASLKSEIEMKVPYITQPKQWPYHTPRPGFDYW